MEELIVRVVDMPSNTIGGVVIVDDEGDYNIYINARKSHAGQREAFEHELRHIRLKHFAVGLSVEDMEKEAK